MSIKTGAVGAYQNSDSGYVPAVKSLIEYLVNELREKAEFYTERARSFIKASLASFPLYTSTEQDVKPLDATETYDCDIFFY